VPESPFGAVAHELRQLPKGMRGATPFDVPTERTAANRYYANRGRGAVEAFSKTVSIPHDPVLAARLRVGMDWIMNRTTVSSEIGRMVESENPTSSEVARFQDTVTYIAERHRKITAKDAAAYARRMRLGETGRRERLGALHHDLNAAINHHRRRFPESSWADVLEAIELTEKQVRRKVR
jgi:hypothetical protein